MFKKLITMMTTSYHAYNPFNRSKVSKNVFTNLYNYYREERIFRKRIQTYVDYITKQCKYERQKYGRVLDYNNSSTFIGVLSWKSKINITKEEAEEYGKNLMKQHKSL